MTAVRYGAGFRPVCAPRPLPQLSRGQSRQYPPPLRYLGAVKFTGLVADGLQTLGGAYAQVLLDAPEKDKYDEKGYER